MGQKLKCIQGVSVMQDHKRQLLLNYLKTRETNDPTHATTTRSLRGKGNDSRSGGARLQSEGTRSHGRGYCSGGRLLDLRAVQTLLEQGRHPAHAVDSGRRAHDGPISERAAGGVVIHQAGQVVALPHGADGRGNARVLPGGHGQYPHGPAIVSDGRRASDALCGHAPVDDRADAARHRRGRAQAGQPGNLCDGAGRTLAIIDDELGALRALSAQAAHRSIARYLSFRGRKRRGARCQLGGIAAALTLLATPALAIAQDAPAPQTDASAPTVRTQQPVGLEAAPLESVPEISLQEALDVATGKQPTIEKAREGIKVAEAQRKVARAGYGPTLSADASIQLWNEELAFDMGLGGGDVPALPPPTTPYEQLIAGMFAAPSEPTIIRGQVTWSASVTLAQPLTPLWMVYHGNKAAQYGEEVAEQQLNQAQRDLARDAAVSYFRLLQTQASLDTANQSVARLEAQVDQLQALVAAGAAKKADMLQIEVAVAAAKQNVATLKGAMRISRAALAVAMGQDPNAPIGATPLGDVGLPGIHGEPDAAIEAALDARPELQQLKLQMLQADQAVKIQQGDYIPQVIAMAQYSHSEGQGLSGSDSAFIGLQASWTIWEWGADYYAVDAAQAQRLQLDSAYTQARRQIGLQVRSAWYDVQSAAEGYAVSTKAVAQAEEAYRIETVRYEAGESTPTDLLAAQSALTEAQNNENNALYQTLIQNTEFVYATGSPLTVERLLGGENP